MNGKYSKNEALSNLVAEFTRLSSARETRETSRGPRAEYFLFSDHLLFLVLCLVFFIFDLFLFFINCIGVTLANGIIQVSSAHSCFRSLFIFTSFYFFHHHFCPLCSPTCTLPHSHHSSRAFYLGENALCFGLYLNKHSLWSLHGTRSACGASYTPHLFPGISSSRCLHFRTPVFSLIKIKYYEWCIFKSQEKKWNVLEALPLWGDSHPSHTTTASSTFGFWLFQLYLLIVVKVK